MRYCFFLLIILFSLSCTEDSEPIRLTGQAQGTYYQVSYFDAQGRNFQDQIDSLLQAYDMSVSIYEDTSVISRFNNNCAQLVQDDIFLANTRLALQVAEASGGAFDPTIGPLVEAWGFGREGKKNLNQKHLDSLMEFTGYHLIEIFNNQVLKHDSRVRLDYNGIAKGYAVDLLGQFLKNQGITSALIDIGGEVLAIGEKPGNEQWSIGIEKPTRDAYEHREVKEIIHLKDRAVATSGSYRRYYEHEGKRYSHTINPQTGHPVDHNMLSVSVIADNCALADAWATAFMAMGPEKSMTLVENQPEKNLEVIIIIDDGEGGYRVVERRG